MIPLELRLVGVRAFENHVINLGDAKVREVVMFGPNGSGKSTIARMLQALVGDVPDDLQQSYLDERSPRVNRKAFAEISIINRKADGIYNPDWPENVTLGFEFGYENNRSFSRYYIVVDGKRQVFRTHEEYASIFRREPYNIKSDDRFMFIQQGESAAMVQMRPRQRYETMKQFLGLEDLEKRWQDTLDARERASKELRDAESQHITLEDGLRRKEIAAKAWRQYCGLWEALAVLERSLADDNLKRISTRLQRLREDEKRLAGSLAADKTKRESLRADLERAKADMARLKGEIDATSTALAGAKVKHSQANEERASARGSVEDAEGAIGSLERIASEGLSLEALEREAASIRERMRVTDESIRDSEARKESLSEALDKSRSDLAETKLTARSMNEDLRAAQETLAKVGQPDELNGRLSPAREALSAARKEELAAQTHLRACEDSLRSLEENKTAVPQEAVAARDAYLAKGTNAVILADAVTLPGDLDRDKRVALEGALGSLRWAVLIEDGRVLVDYKEYTLAEFRPGIKREDAGANEIAGVGNEVTASAGNEITSADAAGPKRVSLASMLRAYMRSASSDRSPVLSRALSQVLDAVLESVVFAQDHNGAAALASRGFVAYAPDGYRYDRYGRQYSAPASLCVGRAAYEAALKQAGEVVTVAKERLASARSILENATGLASKLENDLGQAVSAEGTIQRVNALLPGVLTEHERLDAKCLKLSDDMEKLVAGLTDARIGLALLQQKGMDVSRSLERVKKLADLPRLREELARLREREAAARRQAEAALEECRRLEAAKEMAERQKSSAVLESQRAEERLGDLVPRIDGFERDLEEKRRDVREAEAQSSRVAAEWRATTGKTEMSDHDVLLRGDELASSSQLASEVERSGWVHRIADIRPTVESLKNSVIPTAEEDYVSAKAEFDKAESQLQRVSGAFKEASQRESEAQANFKTVMQETFGRISSRFSSYLSRFGWTGYLGVEPVQGTQFDLQIYLSVYEGTEPRPLLRNRSGGETSAVAALLTLAMVKEQRRPFYIFDEIDQSLDPANVLKLGAILREELDRKYVLISHRLNKAHLEQGQFGIGVYRSQAGGSRTRIYRRKDGFGGASG